MTQTFDIETELRKIVSMTEIVCSTGEYTVNWEDILSELEAYAEKGCAPSDTARFTADIVQAVRERAGYMLCRSDQFKNFTTTGEAAEYLALYALCKVGIASTGENPTPFIDAALKAESMYPDEFLRKALIESVASNITEDGADEIPPLIDAGLLLLDDTGILSALIGEARKRIKDAAWVAQSALNEAYLSVLRIMDV